MWSPNAEGNYGNLAQNGGQVGHESTEGHGCGCDGARGQFKTNRVAIVNGD